MLFGLLGILQVAERDPAGHERLVVHNVDADGAGVAHDLVGELRLVRLERQIGEAAALVPPLVEVGDDERIERCRAQELGGLVEAFGPAVLLDLMEDDAPVGLAVGAGAERGLVALGLHEHGEARLCRLLLGRGQQGDDPLHLRGAFDAVDLVAHVLDEQPVEAPLMVLVASSMGPKRARNPFSRLSGRLSSRQILAASAFALSFSPWARCTEASTAMPAGLRASRPLKYVAMSVGVAAFGKQRLLHLSLQVLAARPVGVLGEELEIVGRLALAAAEPLPFDERAGERIAERRLHLFGLRRVAGRQRLEGGGELRAVLGGKAIAEERRDDRVELGCVSFLACEGRGGLVARRRGTGSRLRQLDACRLGHARDGYKGAAKASPHCRVPCKVGK